MGIYFKPGLTDEWMKMKTCVVQWGNNEVWNCLCVMEEKDFIYIFLQHCEKILIFLYLFYVNIINYFCFEFF